MNRLDGKVAIVTGGAHGIGEAIVEGFVREGARVVIADVDAESAGRSAARLATDRDCTLAVEVDVAKAHEVERLFHTAQERFSNVHVLVNNAGIGSQMNFLDLTEQEWDRVLGVNLRGAYLCAQTAARMMREKGGGSIINVTSLAGYLGLPHNVPYAVSKGGLRSLTVALAVNLAPYGIRVNDICPGAILTEFNRKILENAERKRRFLARIPMDRIGVPSDVAGAAIFLASDESAYVTGTSIAVDGGWSVLAREKVTAE